MTRPLPSRCPDVPCRPGHESCANDPTSLFSCPTPPPPLVLVRLQYSYDKHHHLPDIQLSYNDTDIDMPSAAARLGTKLAGSAITFAILQSATRRGESSPALYTVYALADIALHLMCIQAVSFGAMTALEVSTCIKHTPLVHAHCSPASLFVVSLSDWLPCLVWLWGRRDDSER